MDTSTSSWRITLQTAKNFLYQNNGDGTFTKLTTNSIVTITGAYSGGVWGDFDNDGLLDLYVLEGEGFILRLID